MPYREGMRTLNACGLGDTHLRAGKPELALTEYRRAWQIVQECPTMLAQERHAVRTLAGLAAAYASLRDTARSSSLLHQALTRLEEAKKPQSAAAGANLAKLYYAISVAQIHSGDTQVALETLEKSIPSGWLGREWLERDTELRPMRDLPRFSDLLRRASGFPKVMLQL